MSLSVADYTASAWMQGFNDVGVIVFGMSANELMELKVCPSLFSSFLRMC